MEAFNERRYFWRTAQGSGAGASPVPVATHVDLTITAIDRDRIAYVAFSASLNKADGGEAALDKGREVTQLGEDAHEAASGGEGNVK
jgi:hypothetical protein